MQALKALESGLAFPTHSDILQNLRTALAMNQVSEFAQAQEQQAEPTPWRDMMVVSLVREGINKHRARELADHFAAPQQAEPVAWRDPSNSDPGQGCTYKKSKRDGWPHIYSQPLYTTQPQRQLDKTSFNDWWNGHYDDSENPHEPDSAAYWSWAGWQSAKRPWVGLTDEDCKRMSAGDKLVAMWAEAKLKERNT
jgi:hypothetical protein